MSVQSHNLKIGALFHLQAIRQTIVSFMGAKWGGNIATSDAAAEIPSLVPKYHLRCAKSG
jgi:hypothetical protein